VDADQEGGLLPEDIRLALFRIYQEGMNNIAKHSPGSQVHILFHKDEKDAHLEISDNGPGFEVPEDWLTLARTGHLGLVGMSERAEAVGGRLKVDSAPGQGTRVQVIVPLVDRHK
jgi:signal transduction histidine kinase